MVKKVPFEQVQCLNLTHNANDESIEDLIQQISNTWEEQTKTTESPKRSHPQ